MRRGWTIFASLLGAVIGLAVLEVPVHCHAGESDPAKNVAAEKPKRRMRRMERRRKSERAQKPDRFDQTLPRYQMQVVEGRVIVLDTQTGDARVIDLADEGSKQRVEIGESWITVTVLVNAPIQTSRQRSPANAGKK